MANKVIMLDVDGVLADFLMGYRQIERDLGKEPTQSTKWNAYLDYAVWNRIKSSHDFWYSLPAMPEMQEKGWLWGKIARLCHIHDVYFVTSRYGVNPRAQTVAWLERRGIYAPGVIVAHNKAKVAEAILATHSLEDKAENATTIGARRVHAPHTRSYLVNRPWNATETVDPWIERVDCVEEFVDATV